MNIKEQRRINKEYKLCQEKIIEFIHQGIDYTKEDVEIPTTKDYILYDFREYLGNQIDLTNPKNRFILLKTDKWLKKSN